MTTFDDRKKGFEAKFKHDQELQFKVANRRNKLLGLWAADLMGLRGDEADAYAKEVVASDFDEPGDEDVFKKVAADFAARDVEMSDHMLRKRMDELMGTAQEQIRDEA
ncbi:MAG: DUF1476 domain-containing protein [Pseudomonadota bacterium]